MAAKLLENDAAEEENEQEMNDKELKEEEKSIQRVKDLIEKLKPGGVLSTQNKKVFDPKKKAEKSRPLNKKGKRLANLSKTKKLKTKKVGKNILRAIK